MSTNNSCSEWTIVSPGVGKESVLIAFPPSEWLPRSLDHGRLHQGQTYGWSLWKVELKFISVSENTFSLSLEYINTSVEELKSLWKWSSMVWKHEARQEFLSRISISFEVEKCDFIVINVKQS